MIEILLGGQPSNQNFLASRSRPTLRKVPSVPSTLCSARPMSRFSCFIQFSCVVCIVQPVCVEVLSPEISLASDRQTLQRDPVFNLL